MALAVASVASTGTWGLANPPTTTITKPSGLAVGDLMVAFIANTSAGTGCDTPAGWTKIRDGGAAGHSSSAFYIVATATETAASNFVFVATGGGNARMGGGILRITGFVAASPIDTSNGAASVANDSTPNYTMTVTPTLANSLLLFMNYTYSTGGGTDVSTSAQAITTSNPTWTEAFDLPGPGLILGMAVAYAIRTQITATGDFTATLSVGDNSEDSDGIAVVVKPIQDATVIPAVITSVSSVQAPTNQVGVTLTPSVITSASSVQAPVTSINPWITTNKSVSTGWINPDKSTT